MSSLTTVSCVQWTPKGSAKVSLKPGSLAGFEPYFKNSPANLASFFIGLTGHRRFDVVNWLNQKAIKSGMDQHVTEMKLELHHSYTERINGSDALGMPTAEYDLMKSTTALKEQITVAWCKAILREQRFQNYAKSVLLEKAVSSELNDFLVLSAELFSKAVEMMHPEFQNARVIFLPAIPVAYTEWNENPARLIAFKKESIVSVKSSVYDDLFA